MINKSEDKSIISSENLWWNTFTLVFKISFRSFKVKKTWWLGTFIFAICLLILFPFSLGTAVIKRPDVQIGCYWAMMEFVAALCVGRMFQAEHEAQALDILLSSRSQRSAILFGKLSFMSLFLFSLQIPILLFWMLFFNVETPSFFLFIENFLLANFFFSFGSASIGILVYTITTKSQGKEILQPILFFPLQTGILLACVSVTLIANSLNNLSGAFNAQSWWTILIFYPILFSALGWIFSPTLFEE